MICLPPIVPFVPRACAALAIAAGLSPLPCAADVALVPPAHTPAHGPAATLPAAIGQALRQAEIPADAVSMLVLPVDGAPARLDHLSQLSRQPASLIKLFTTGVALTTLGPAFTWRTEVALGGPLTVDGRLHGPLFLRGSGDPSLVLENLWLMVSRWRAAGLQDIAGGIVVDRGAFSLPPHDPAAFDGEPLKPYNAGPDALLLNQQAITLHLSPDAARPGRARVSMAPELDGVRLESLVVLQDSADCGAWREGLSLEMLPSANANANASGIGDGAPRPWTLRVRGPFPRACGAREWPLLWQGDGPGDHAARLLRQLWQAQGGRVGGIRPGSWPEGTPVWQSWTSPPLPKVVQDINKFSNNVMARQLFLTLAPPPAPATLEGARQAVSMQVRLATAMPAAATSRPPTATAGHSPCEGDALVLDNGSGLSRQERSSAACIGQWLLAMWASPVMPEFLASLPVTGVDGTARRLGNGSGGGHDSGASLIGRAHIKTGSLEGVMAIAGIVHGESGRRHIVVGLINHPQAKAGRPAMDALLTWAVRDRP